MLDASRTPPREVLRATEQTPVRRFGPRRFAYARNGGVLAIGEGDAIHVYRVETNGRVIPQYTPLSGSARPLALDILDDGSRLVAIEQGYGVRLWNLSDGTPQTISFPGWGRAQAVAFSQSDRSVVVGSSDGFLRVWHDGQAGPSMRCMRDPARFRPDDPPCSNTPSDLAIAACLDGPDPLVTLLASPSGEQFEDARVLDDDLIVVRTSNGALAWRPGASPTPWSRTVTTAAPCTSSPAGHRWKIVLDRVGRQERARVEPVPYASAVAQQGAELGGWPEGVRCVSFSRGGDRVVALTQRGRVHVSAWPPLAQSTAAALDGRTEVTSLSLSEDGEMVAIARANGWVELWRVFEGMRSAGSFLVQSGPRIGLHPEVMLSPDARYLLVTASDGTFDLRELPALRSIPLLNAPLPEERALSGQRRYRFSPDGRHLAGVLYGRDVAVWNVETGGVLLLQGHTAQVSYLEFSTDGRHLASVGAGGEVNLWDLSPTSRNRLVATFDAPPGWATFAVPLGGDRLLIGGPAGVLVYPTGSDGTIRLARRLRAILDPQRRDPSDGSRCPALP